MLDDTKHESLDVFMLLRLELSFAQDLESLLTEICRASPPLERKVPRDPYSCIPVRRDVSSSVREHRVCFEQVDFVKLRFHLESLDTLLKAFEPL